VVLTVTATRIARLVVFGDPGLFSRFGFPPTADDLVTGR
jgi:predicted N-acetyltransferase YhbS